MTKGSVTIAIIILLVGVTAGLSVTLLASNAAHQKLTLEYYLADLKTIETLYKARNIQEYLVIGKDTILAGLYESGGTTGCGTVSFDNGAIEIWKSSECEVTGFSEDEINRVSGIIAEQAATIYAPAWGVAVSKEEDSFCFSRLDELPFGQYDSRICFQSSITTEIGNALLDMLGRVDPETHDCACMDSYKVCWDNEEFNFTYAVVEDC